MSYSKYKNVKKVIAGIKFDSKLESEYYEFMKEKGIEVLEFQSKIYLTKSRILYKPDFMIEEDGKNVYIDVKGMQTPVFNLKKKLWKHYGPARLILVKKNGAGWYYSDIIDVE